MVEVKPMAASASIQIQKNSAGRKEKLIEGVITAAGLSAVGIIGMIFIFLLREGLPAFVNVPPSEFFPPAGIQSKISLDCCRSWWARCLLRLAQW